MWRHEIPNSATPGPAIGLEKRLAVRRIVSSAVRSTLILAAVTLRHIQKCPGIFGKCVFQDMAARLRIPQLTLGELHQDVVQPHSKKGFLDAPNNYAVNLCTCCIAALPHPAIVHVQHFLIFVSYEASGTVQDTRKTAGVKTKRRYKSMSVATHLSAPFDTVSERTGAWIENTKTRYARYRAYRETLNELSGLSSRDLADLGLHRSELRRVAYQAAQDAHG